MVKNMIPEVVQEKLGWQSEDIEKLKGDMEHVKEEVHELKVGLTRLEEKLEAQAEKSTKAHDRLSKDIGEIKTWVIGGVKAILGAIITIVTAVLIRYLM